MSNFSLLSQYDEQLLRLGMLAEKYFADDPNTCLIKLRQLGESLAQMLAARTGLYVSPEETQHDLLRRLQDGGEADSATLKFNKGARPAKNRNLPIAEWPSESGPADYVLFVGLSPVAVVEAKRKNIDVSGALQQAKRYSRSFTPTSETLLTAENWGVDAAYRIPFAFSSNGRSFLRQLATKSGIWFCDLRHSDNLGHPLDGWYTPEGLTALIKRDEASAHAQLATMPFNYGFLLRYYQQDAIRAAEQAIEHGQREMLLVMATGTGKTKTCIALIYRLLKAKRFRRILFLVDRSALGEQAANAFKDICDYLATELDPASRQKTLIFCVTDAHVDMVVNLLKKAFATQYGSLDIAWLKDDNATDAQDLPEPALLAQEAMGELEGAMEELRGILEELGEELVEPRNRS